MQLNQKEKIRFWDNVVKTPNCWYWVGCKNSNGYGNIRINYKIYLTHRLSYFIYFGDIPENMCVCHTCDNPSCVNPAHLWVGSRSENTRDMIKKGRQGSYFKYLKTAKIDI